MTKTELYKDGARLPDQLSRLLFLESVVPGRRVLEVGARSDDVAAFLLSLGAQRVVCAVSDRDLVERLRDTCTLEHVDFRAIRPAAGSRPPGAPLVPPLPADDGAFDLVLDFELPAALARGEHARLADLRRLLSPDGFVVTALPSTTQPGLDALLLPRGAVEVPTLPTYRELVHALQAEFPLVQAYFQSLLLGYLFGTFDVEPSGEGIAPQTALVGHEPEPAGAYVFAFGNATPVVEDVCLVQIPCAALLRATSPRPAPSTDAAPAGQDELIAELQRRDAVIDQLRDALELARRSPTSTRARDEDGIDGDDEVVVEQAAVTRLPGEAEAVATLVRGLDDAAARVVELEARHAAAIVELERVTTVRDRMRTERDALAADLVGAHGEHGELQRQLRLLRDDNDVLALRLAELEDAIVALESQRSRLSTEVMQLATAREGDRQRADAERAMFEAALASRAEDVAALEAERDTLALRLAALHDERTVDVGRHAAEHAAADDAASRRLAAAEARATNAEDAAVRAAAQLAIVEASLRDARAHADARLRDAVEAAEHALRTREAAHAEELEQLRLALEHEKVSSAAAPSASALEDERGRMQARIDALEADAVKLADAIKVLVAERDAARADAGAGLAAADQTRAQLGAATAALEDARRALQVATADAELKANGLQADLTTLRHTLDEARDANATTAAEQGARLDDLARLRRNDQRLIEELRLKLTEARAAVDDVTAQRTVLQGALAAREADAAGRAGERDALAAELERVLAALAEADKRYADLVADAAARSDEVRRLQATVEAIAHERRELEAIHDAADAGLREAEQARHALQATVERLTGERDEALAALAEARLTGAGAADRLREDADAREARLRADHEGTRDELAHLTESMLQLEAAIADERAQHDEARAQHDAERARLHAQMANGQRLLDETRAALATLRAQHDDEAVEARRQIELLRTEARSRALEASSERQRADEQSRALAARIDELTAALRAAEDERAALIARHEDAQRAHDDARQARDEALRAKDEARRARDEALRAHDEAFAAATTKAEAAHAEALARLGAALAEAEAQARQARDDAARDAATAAAKQAEMQREMFEADEMLDNASADMARLQGEVTTLRRAVDDALRARADEVDALTQQLDERQVEAARLEAMLFERERAVEELRRALHEKAEALSAAEEAVAQARREHGVELESVRATLEDQAGALHAQRAEMARMQAEHADLHAAHERALAGLTLLQATLGEAQTSLSRERDECGLLRALLDEAQRALAAERARGELASAQLADARQTWADERAGGETLRAQRDEARADAARLADEFHALSGLQRAHAETCRLLETERARAELAGATLDGAQRALVVERARGDVAAAALEEARLALVVERERADHDGDEAARIAAAARDDAQHLLAGERSRADGLAAALVDAERALAVERARADLAAMQLAEATEAGDDERDRLRRAAEDTETRSAALLHELQHALDAARAATSAVQNQLRDEQLARSMHEAQTAALAAELAALRAQLHEEVGARRAFDAERAALEELVAAVRAEAAERSAHVDSLQAELRGVREALQMAREDAREFEGQLELATTNATLPPDLAAELAEARSALDAAMAARETADAQRDGAIADLEAARVSARLESRRRADLDAELQRVRAERDQLFAAATAAAAPSPATEGKQPASDDGDDGDHAEQGADPGQLRQRIAELERAARTKDQKIAEQAERIERLTDRIIRTEDTGRGR